MKKDQKNIVCIDGRENWDIFEKVLKENGFKLLDCREKHIKCLYINFLDQVFWYSDRQTSKVFKALKLNYENFVWEFLKNFQCVLNSVEDKIWIAKQFGNNNPYIASNNKFCCFEDNDWLFYDIIRDDKLKISFSDFQKLVNSINEPQNIKYYIILKNSIEKKAFASYLEEYKKKCPQIKAKIVPNTFYSEQYDRFRLCEDQNVLIASSLSDDVIDDYEVLFFAEIEKFMESLLFFYKKEITISQFAMMSGVSPYLLETGKWRQEGDEVAQKVINTWKKIKTNFVEIEEFIKNLPSFYSNKEFTFDGGFKAIYNKEKNTITIEKKERKLKFWRQFTDNLLVLNENIVVSGLDISKEDVLNFKRWLKNLEN